MAVYSIGCNLISRLFLIFCHTWRSPSIQELIFANTTCTVFPHICICFCFHTIAPILLDTFWIYEFHNICIYNNIFDCITMQYMLLLLLLPCGLCFYVLAHFALCCCIFLFGFHLKLARDSGNSMVSYLTSVFAIDVDWWLYVQPSGMWYLELLMILSWFIFCDFGFYWYWNGFCRTFK